MNPIKRQINPTYLLSLFILGTILPLSLGWIQTTTTTRRVPTLLHATPSSHNATHRALRLSKAQFEIDRILNSPNAPFDEESEINKVTELRFEPDDDDNLLESQLHDAIRVHDLSSAANIQKQLDQSRFDDFVGMLQCNSKFYRAFRNKDARLMERVWLPDPTAMCLHPSMPPILGQNDIIKSWETIFGANSHAKIWMESSNVKVCLRGKHTGVVLSEERVYTRRFVRGQKRSDECLNRLVSTHIFRNVGNRWYLTHRHASWHAKSAVAKEALRVAAVKSAPDKTTRASKLTNDASSLDGVLGVQDSGPILGDESDGPQQPMRQQIIMGSGNLSDLLSGGGLSDILKNMGSSGSSIKPIVHVEAEFEDEEDDEDYSPGAVDEIQIVEERRRPTRHDQEGSDQDCVRALQKLGREGLISPNQKRHLISNIIRSKTEGSTSEILVAYNLLSESELFDEEFAEQCRIIADSSST